MIQLTRTAAAEVRAALEAKGIEGFGLRVQVVGGGCEGFLYDVLYTDLPDPGDQIFESQGVMLFVDRRALPVIDGLTIDHAKTSHGDGFVFHNPTARTRCSCSLAFRNAVGKTSSSRLTSGEATATSIGSRNTGF